MRRRVILTDDEEEDSAALDLCVASVVSGKLGAAPSAADIGGDTAVFGFEDAAKAGGRLDYDAGRSDIIVLSSDVAVDLSEDGGGDDSDYPPVLVPSGGVIAGPMNLLQYAARHGRFPSLPARSAAAVVFHIEAHQPNPEPQQLLPARSDAAPASACLSLDANPSLQIPSVYADREAACGDSTSSGSSGSSGSELSGDFVVHEESGSRSRKETRMLEKYFPVTAKRLRMARVAPNLVASRPYRKHRDSQGFLE